LLTGRWQASVGVAEFDQVSTGSYTGTWVQTTGNAFCARVGDAFIHVQGSGTHFAGTRTAREVSDCAQLPDYLVTIDISANGTTATVDTTDPSGNCFNCGIETWTRISGASTDQRWLVPTLLGGVTFLLIVVVVLIVVLSRNSARQRRQVQPPWPIHPGGVAGYPSSGPPPPYYQPPPPTYPTHPPATHPAPPPPGS
jgi:hypothetical protein